MLIKGNGTLGRGISQMAGNYSFIDAYGSFHIEATDGRAINTSTIVLAYQSGDMSICFRTRSGSTYEVIVENTREFSTSLFSSIAECIDECMPGFEPLKYCQLTRFFQPTRQCYG